MPSLPPAPGSRATQIATALRQCCSTWEPPVVSTVAFAPPATWTRERRGRTLDHVCRPHLGSAATGETDVDRGCRQSVQLGHRTTAHGKREVPRRPARCQDRAAAELDIERVR